MAVRYEEALRYLWGLRRLGAKSDLTVIQAILKDLGDPQRTFRSIHITGSKGKGSTAEMCASVLKAAGYRTGLYTSPHLLSYRERTVVDGKKIPKEKVAECVQSVRESADRLLATGKVDREPTFFEVTTAMAFTHFQREKVDAGVVEVGLGGRLDATNTLDSSVCAVTTLELEHTEILGPTLTHIAREKSGIFHKGARAVTGVTSGEGYEELARNAFRLGVPLWRLGKEVQADRTSFDRTSQTFDVHTPLHSHPGLKSPLLGSFQVDNAGVAVAALDLFSEATGLKIPEKAYRQGLAATVWPGRLERLSNRPPFYADAAHTVMSAQALAGALEEIEPEASPQENVLLFSCLKDKRMEEILATLSGLAATLVLTELKNDRAMPVKEMERVAKGLFQRILVAPQMSQAISLARSATGPHGYLLATGSTYLISEVEAVAQGVTVEEPGLSDPLPSPRGPGVASSSKRRRAIPQV